MMFILIYHVVPIIGSLFLIAALFHGIRQMGQNNENFKKVTESGVVLLYTAVTVLAALLESSIVNLLLLLVIPVLCRWMYKTGKIQIIYGYLLITSVYVTDALVTLTIQNLLIKGLIYLNSQELVFLCLLLVLRLIEFLVIRLFVLIVRRHMGKQITMKQLVVSLILPAFSIVNLWTLIVFIQIYMTEEMLMLFILNTAMLLGINFYFTVLVDAMSEKNRLESELMLAKQQAALQVSYYEHEKEKNEETRKLIHDIRNHMQIMERLFAGENSGEAADYAASVHELLNNLGQKYYTSDKLLNIIFNDKAAVMKKEGIQEDIKTGDIQMDFMREIDVTAIFANLLDNAITAAKGSENPFIKIRVNNIHQFLSITMENSAAAPPQVEGRKIKSSKKGHQGLGMKIIRKAVENYGGDMQWEWKKGVFYTQIMLNTKIEHGKEQKC